MTADSNCKKPFPEFLTKEFFEKALKCDRKSTNICITDFKLSMGCSVGDNYCSDIYRANIKYKENGIENKHISLIVKAIPYSETRGPVLEDLDVFDKEIKMYTETLPKLSAILSNEIVCAKCIYSTKEPILIAVFQDLNSLEYVMADRHSGLDELHCNVVLTKLGRIHAASMVLAEKEPHSMDPYSNGMIKLGGAAAVFMESLFGNGLSTFTDVVKGWPGYEHIVEKMKTLRVNFPEKIGRHCNSTPSAFKVLNHGDLWINNILFKYEHGKPVDVVFVDYQMSYYSSPGMDLNYFICTSPQCEVREKKRDMIISTYYNAFAKTLCQLGSKQKISLDEMKKEISTRELFGLLAAIGILPVIMLNKETSKESSIDNLAQPETAEKLRNAMYTEPAYQNAMKYMLNRCYDLKTFDTEN